MEEFQTRIQQFQKQREQAVSKIEKPSKKSEPADIQAYQNSLAESLRQERAAAKQGDIFTATVTTYIRQTIRQEYRGKRLAELRKDLADIPTKGVPLRVNHPYPQHRPLAEMPPELLLKLPLLPKELRYRLVGANLLLIDQESLLVIDFITRALP